MTATSEAPSASPLPEQSLHPELNGVERLYIWSGLVGLAVIFVGMVTAHMLPPPAPSRTPEEFADFYRGHIQSVRIGTTLVGCGAVFLMPWYSVIARRFWSIPGHGPATAFCILGSGAVLMYQIVMPMAIGQVAAFRPERSAEDITMLNDLFFIIFICPVYVYLVQLLVSAVAILGDRSSPPAFPRWVGYLCLWTSAFSFGPALLIFFKSGLWAWNGVFGLWVAAIVFGIWIAVFSAAVLVRPRVEPGSV